MGAANKLYNGNIAETFWRTATDGGFVRNYGYKYDKLNRLKDATYQKSGQLTGMYNENLSYDKNGNIMNLSRYGDRDEQYLPIQIDNLQYGYATNSNKLMSVVDNSNNTSGFKDGITTGDDYVYDANGNMTVDKNKNITTITYNHLNLPTKIIFPTGNIVYFYNASGQKVQKVVTENATVTTTDYLGGYQYQNTVLQFFPTAEGYVKNTPVSGTNTYSYVFNYTDHLGNVRLSYTKDTTGSLKILEENNYYPFGLKHNSYNIDNFQPGYKYKYNGKELQDELGLNFYDYPARNYDPALGRWMNIDPLAEQGRRFSPYNYALNNPVYFLDPDGMLSQSFMDTLMNSASGTTWTNNNDGTFSSNSGETVSDGETGGDPPAKKGRLDQIVTIRGQKYHKNTNSLPASIGNEINSWFGGDSDYFVEHKPYDPVEEEMLNETINQGVGFIAGGYIAKGIGKAFGAIRFGPGTSMASKVLQLAEKMGIKSGQTGVNQEIVEMYYQQMVDKSYKAVGGGGFQFNGKFILTEGNHKMIAALRYGIETGNFTYAETIVNSGRFTVANPAQYGVKTFKLPVK